MNEEKTSLSNEFIDKFVITRTYSAGVHAGILKELDGTQAVLEHSRRIWCWAAAATLSQLAVDGTSKPDECKFPCSVPSTILTEVIEILLVSDKAKKSILSVPVWSE